MGEAEPITEGSVSDTIDIIIEGRYGSIPDLEWSDVPPFAVLTGVNGAGKTQFLEVLAASYGALRPRNPYQRGFNPHEEITARASIEGASFEVGEVFRYYGRRSIKTYDSLPP